MEKMAIDCLVIGAGLAGSTCARLLADRGIRVRILERRSVVGGNLYDKRLNNGIIVHRYGPHIFHTNDERVMAFLKRFATFYDFDCRSATMMQGKMYAMPFSFLTLDTLYGGEKALRIRRKLLSLFPEKNEISVIRLLKAQDEEVSAFAQYLFEHDYRPYTARQWNLAPHQVDSSVLERLPIRLSEDCRCFTDRYQGLPEEGYTQMIKNMLDSPNIQVQLGFDAFGRLNVDNKTGRMMLDGQLLTCPIIYTGTPDALFGFSAGVLPYRSLRFEWEFRPEDSFQNTPLVCHPERTDYLRVTEYKKIMKEASMHGTVISYEYPIPADSAAGHEPYYPVLTQESRRMNDAYRLAASRIPGLVLCGRLAEFRYYNMDQTILSSMEAVQKIQ